MACSAARGARSRRSQAVSFLLTVISLRRRCGMRGIPYRLKQYIDLIHQPGLLWTLNPETGYHGLLDNKHATLALTAGVYFPGVRRHNSALIINRRICVSGSIKPV